MPRSSARSAGEWSWWSTSIPASPRSLSRANAASSRTERPLRPQGCAITVTPPAATTSPIISSRGVA